MGHVEAGLRTYDKYSPFPEEMNRTLVGGHGRPPFLPHARPTGRTWRRRGSAQGRIRHRQYGDRRARRPLYGRIIALQPKLLNELDYTSKKVIAGHLPPAGELRGAHGTHHAGPAAAGPDLSTDAELVYPVHLSPGGAGGVPIGTWTGIANVHLIDPLAADEMHNLMARCYLVMTDSGGLQEEAPALGKPVLVLRRETERPEAVAAGTVQLAGTEEEHIFRHGRAAC